jgi:phosphatidate cytidylyltransferase
MSSIGGNWSDLLPRVLSALVMTVVGVAAIWIGGSVFIAMIACIAGIILWEVTRMLVEDSRQLSLVLGVVMAACIVLCGKQASSQWLVLLVPATAMWIFGKKNRWIGAIFALEVALGGATLIHLMTVGGAIWIVALVAIIVASDTAGYFVGRTLGGPKFWPAISPKKTWSGTIAGWLASAIVAMLLAPYLGLPNLTWVAIIGAALSFAGQMGDIAESWLKRRIGVKDASNLIPGHGGFFDRFDAMLGASCAVSVFAMLGFGL